MLDDAAARDLDLAELADQRAEIAALSTAIAGLPSAQRQAVILRELYGLSYREVSAALGVSGPAVESLLFKGRKRLQDRLRPLHGAVAMPAAVREMLARSIPGSRTEPGVPASVPPAQRGISAKILTGSAAAKIAALVLAAGASTVALHIPTNETSPAATGANTPGPPCGAEVSASWTARRSPSAFRRRGARSRAGDDPAAVTPSAHGRSAGVESGIEPTTVSVPATVSSLLRTAPSARRIWPRQPKAPGPDRRGRRPAYNRRVGRPSYGRCRRFDRRAGATRATAGRATRGRARREVTATRAVRPARARATADPEGATADTVRRARAPVARDRATTAQAARFRLARPQAARAQAARAQGPGAARTGQQPGGSSTALARPRLAALPGRPWSGRPGHRDEQLRRRPRDRFGERRPVAVFERLAGPIRLAGRLGADGSGGSDGSGGQWIRRLGKRRRPDRIRRRRLLR